MSKLIVQLIHWFLENIEEVITKNFNSELIDNAKESIMKKFKFRVSETFFKNIQGERGPMVP